MANPGFSIGSLLMRMLVLYLKLTNPIQDLHHKPGRGMFRIPRVRHISAVVRYHRCVPVQAIYGDAKPELRAISVAFPFSRRDGGVHDEQSTRTNSMNRPGAYHSRTTCP